MYNMDYEKHYIRTDADNRVIHAYSTSFEQPVDGDILINDQGGRHVEINGETNPTLRDMHGISLYKWDEKAGILKRSEQSINADYQASLQTPQARISTLSAQINKDLPAVVAQLYDIVMAQVKVMNTTARRSFESALTNNEISIPIFNVFDELVENENENELDGITLWRMQVNKLDALISSIQQSKGVLNE